MNPTLRIEIGDAIEVLKTLPEKSVHCCVTSPPYWGLRDYGTGTWIGGDAACDHKGRSQTSGASTLGEWKSGGGAEYKEGTGGIPFKDVCGKCGAQRVDKQIGLEKTPEEFIAKLVTVFREVHRVLRDDGTCWINLGDSYNGQGARSPNIQENGDLSYRAGGNAIRVKGLKPKDLCMIPARFALALQADGWYLRQDIIWAKPNPMPESVTDRCTKSHEYIFLLSKQPRYFYDAEAIKEPVNGGSHARKGYKTPDGWDTTKGQGGHGAFHKEGREKGQTGYVPKGNGVTPKSAPPGSGIKANESFSAAVVDLVSNRNKRSVWTVATESFSEAHFATFPQALITPCILAGTSGRGCCAKCGAPYERVVELGEPDLAHQRACGGDANGEYAGQSTKDYGSAKAQDASATKARILAGMRQRKTVAWNSTCKCEAEIVPCTVLDPFGGSGTTGLVAIEHGRSAILIELNPEYVEIARSRTNTTPGLAL